MLSDDPDIYSDSDRDMDLYKILQHPVTQHLKERHLLNETRLRNLKIKGEYQNLRKFHNAMDAKFILSEKYFLSYDTIEGILFRR